MRTFDHIRPCGGKTKPRLSAGENQRTETLDLTGLDGIIEYQPSEYTFSAWAGTPIKDIATAIGERGQYLPFDPLWVEAGATFGGTVAANAAGAGRIRYGSVRDFIIGVRIVDGRGRIISGGGKVVKNAAGFDLPKFFTGSLGRWGVMTQIVCKVFPRPESSLTRQWDFEDHAAAMSKMTALARSPLEPDALEYDPQAKRLFMRVTGPKSALPTLIERIGGEPGPDNPWWNGLNGFQWCQTEAALIRIALSPLRVTDTLRQIETEIESRCWVSGAGNSIWVSTREVTGLEQILVKRVLTGLVHQTAGLKEAPLWLGAARDRKIDSALQAVFDPDQRFGSVC
ncbi:MAG: FAD-binding protein [Synoicihabitans sp.]